MLAEKAGANIVAQELLELLISQIMDHKTKEFDYDDKANPVKPNESPGNEQQKKVIETSNVHYDKFIAVSDKAGKEDMDPSCFQKENIDLDTGGNFKHTKLNTRGILNSKDFQSVMAITTLVPFIKSGIPRLSNFDVKEAKLAEKDMSRKHKSPNFPTKIFTENLAKINQYKYAQERIIEEVGESSPTQVKSENGQNKQEFDNISKHQDLKEVQKHTLELDKQEYNQETTKMKNLKRSDKTPKAGRYSREKEPVKPLLNSKGKS